METPASAPGFELSPAAAAPGRCPPELLVRAAAQVTARFEESQPGPESFPGTASRILEVIRRPNVDFNELVRAVSQDAGIAARLLQVANSALYASAAPAESVRAAALRLGAREVGHIAFAIAGRSLFQAEARVQYHLFRERWDRLFHDSMTAGFAAGALALRARGAQPDSAFLAGMFHDVGKSLALRALADVYATGELDPTVFAHGIDDVLERVHVPIGAAMAATWSLPDAVRVAAERHHDMDLDDDPAHVHVHLVRVIDGLCAVRRGELGEDGRDAMMTSAALLGLTSAELRVAAAEVAAHAARVTEMFAVADPASPPAPRRVDARSRQVPAHGPGVSAARSRVPG